MSKRYYFTCPIKAAYMNHEFGVITYIELSIKSEIYDKYFIKDWNHRELGLDAKDKYHCNKYYVAPESEHIFEPEEGDFVSNYLHGNKGRHSHGFLSARSNLTTSVTIITPERKNETSYFVESKSQITIIMRDNKHFFTPNREVH